MTADGPAAGRGLLPRAKSFRPHFYCFMSALIAVIVANVGFGAGLPLFWPLGAWSVLVAVHYFIASALDVDERWVAERASELRIRSYDFDHIRDIRERIEKHDDSVVHHAERDK